MAQTVLSNPKPKMSEAGRSEAEVANVLNSTLQDDQTADFQLYLESGSPAASHAFAVCSFWFVTE